VESKFEVLLCLAVATVSAACAQLPSADALLSDIEANGAALVLHRLSSDDRQFDAMCEAIGTGNPDWLEVARRLKPASDAAASLSLNYCVARALPVAPTRVLGLVGRSFELDDVCTSPFIEPELDVAERYEERALAALATLRDSQIASLAEQCAERVKLPARSGEWRRSHLLLTFHFQLSTSYFP
jgi:hypothetical protein